MMLVYLALTAAVSVVIGFLIGDRRGVREANEVLAHNNKVLLEAIGESVKAPVEDEGQRPVMH